MTCAGSLFFEDLPKQDTNPAAEEGIAAGEYLEHLLLGTQPTPTQARNGIDFNDDMKFYTTEIAEKIKSEAKSQILCEQKIDWQTRSGIWIKGKYDASFIDDEGILNIADLKYGWNIVEVKENWQLLGYVIGEILRRGEAFTKVRLWIYQPRPHHEDGTVRKWEVSYEEVLEYKERIEARLDKIAAGHGELVTSAKCKYCPATASACPAFSRAVYNGIDHVLTQFLQDDIDDQEVSFQLDLLTRVNDVLKIKTDSLKQLAVDRIKNGKVIPGYVTEENYGDRKWKKDVSPLSIEVLTGFKIVESVMLSPAKAEKVGVPKDLVKSLVERYFLGQKLVKKDATKIGDKIFGKRE
jgi:hypothetical protein